MAASAPLCRAEPPGLSSPAPGGGSAEVSAREAKPQVHTLRMKHHWTGEYLEVVYRIGDVYQPEAMAEIDHFLRDWRCNKTIRMDPKLIDRLYDLQQKIGSRSAINVISGYRSEGYNASLLVSGRTVDPESQHMFGRAVDLFVPGYPTEKLKDAAESQELGGVGHYPFSGPRFIHVDTGPQRHWTELDPAVKRRLGMAKRPRTRFRLDCDMTMAEALRDVSPLEAISALPPGASVNPAATFHRAAFAQASPLPEHTQATGGGSSPISASVHAETAGVCEGSAPLPPLGLLGEPDSD